jgi:hypothetical protein
MSRSRHGGCPGPNPRTRAEDGHLAAFHLRPVRSQRDGLNGTVPATVVAWKLALVWVISATRQWDR